MNGNGLDFPLFVKEFGKSIAGEAFIGVMNLNSGSADVRKETKPTPKCTAKQARAMLVEKLVTNFKDSRNAFARFNPARDNAMTTTKLRSVLTQYHIHLSDDEFAKLAKEFDESDSGLVNFQKFISVVGAEVGGMADDGLSAKMQAAADMQRAKFKHFHKDLGHQSFESSDSESEIYNSRNVQDAQFTDVPQTKQCQSLALSTPGYLVKHTPAATAWDIKGKRPCPVTSANALHTKHWRLPPSRPLPRIVSKPLVVKTGLTSTNTAAAVA